jgi:hypothetical protein
LPYDLRWPEGTNSVDGEKKDWNGRDNDVSQFEKAHPKQGLWIVDPANFGENPVRRPAPPENFVDSVSEFFPFFNTKTSSFFIS